MGIVISFTIGIIVGIVLSPKKFSLEITKNDLTPQYHQTIPMSQEEIMELIRVQDELSKKEEIEPINEEDLSNAVSSIIDSLMEDDNL